MTTTTQTNLLPRERNLLLGLLLVLAAVAWGVLIWQSQIKDKEEMGLTMGMRAPLFIALWAVMMVAIMYPTAAPMILTFERVQASRQQAQQSFVPTWLFVASYIVLWSATGLLAYGVTLLADDLAEDSLWL